MHAWLPPQAHHSNNVGGGQPNSTLSPLPQPQKLSNSGAGAPSPGLGVNGAAGASGSASILGHIGTPLMAAAPAATLGSPSADLRARRISAPGQNLFNGVPDSGVNTAAAGQTNFATGGLTVAPSGRFSNAGNGAPKKGFLFVEEDDKEARGGAKAQQEQAITGKAAVAALKLRQEAAAGMKGVGRRSSSGEAAGGGAIYSVPPIPTAGKRFGK